MRRAKGMLDAKDSHVEALRARVDVGAGHRLAMAAAGLHTDAKSVRVDAAATCKGIVMRIERPGMRCVMLHSPGEAVLLRQTTQPRRGHPTTSGFREAEEAPRLASPAIRGGYPLRQPAGGIASLRSDRLIRGGYHVDTFPVDPFLGRARSWP